jgi:hypothetical protein
MRITVRASKKPKNSKNPPGRINTVPTHTVLNQIGIAPLRFGRQLTMQAVCRASPGQSSVFAPRFRALLCCEMSIRRGPSTTVWHFCRTWHLTVTNPNVHGLSVDPDPTNGALH